MKKNPAQKKAIKSLRLQFPSFLPITLTKIIGLVIFLNIMLLSFWLYLHFIHTMNSARSLDQSFAGENTQVAKGQIINYKEDTKYVTKLFTTENDLRKAYAMFKSHFQKSDQTYLHSLAHVVGQVLYQKTGLKGVQICDSSFAYGCFHGVLGLAIRQEGRAIIAKAESICWGDKHDQIQFNGCLHGLGHSVLEIKGYKNIDLVNALHDCDLLSNNGESPCYNGVFMEFNRRVPFANYGTDLKPREFVAATPYAPCDWLNTKYQSECYVEQPAWWSVVISHGAYDKKVERIGVLCQGIPDTNNKQQCFRGIARMMPINQNPQKTKDDFRRYCTLLPTGEGVYYCIDSAVQLLTAQHTPSASDLCVILDPSYIKSCLSNERYL